MGPTQWEGASEGKTDSRGHSVQLRRVEVHSKVSLSIWRVLTANEFPDVPQKSFAKDDHRALTVHSSVPFLNSPLLNNLNWWCWRLLRATGGVLQNSSRGTESKSFEL